MTLEVALRCQVRGEGDVEWLSISLSDMMVNAEWLLNALRWAGLAGRGMPDDLSSGLAEDYGNSLEYAELYPLEAPKEQTWFMGDELYLLFETEDESGLNHLSVRWWQRLVEGQSSIGRATRFVAWFTE